MASSRTGNGQHDLPALWPAVGRPLSYCRGYQEDEPLHKNRFPGSIHGRNTNLHVTEGRSDEPDASDRGSLEGQGEAPSSMSGSTHVAQRHPPCPNPARLFDLTCRIHPLIASSSGLPGFSPLGRTNSCHKPRPLVTERARSARKAIHDTYRCTSCVRRGRGEQGLWRYRRPNLRRSERAICAGRLAGPCTAGGYAAILKLVWIRGGRCSSERTGKCYIGGKDDAGDAGL
jgi:hypothetical protein